MKTLRPHTFETNSSSSHELCIVPTRIFEQFKNGELFVNWGTNSMMTVDEMFKEFIKQMSDYGEKSVDDLTIEEFTFALNYIDDLKTCYDAMYEDSADKAKLSKKFQTNYNKDEMPHLTKKCMALIGEWLCSEDIMNHSTWQDLEEDIAFSDQTVVDNVSVTVFGKFGWH